MGKPSEEFVKDSPALSARFAPQFPPVAKLEAPEETPPTRWERFEARVSDLGEWMSYFFLSRGRSSKWGKFWGKRHPLIILGLSLYIGLSVYKVGRDYYWTTYAPHLIAATESKKSPRSAKRGNPREANSAYALAKKAQEDAYAQMNFLDKGINKGIRAVQSSAEVADVWFGFGNLYLALVFCSAVPLAIMGWRRYRKEAQEHDADVERLEKTITEERATYVSTVERLEYANTDEARYIRLYDIASSKVNAYIDAGRQPPQESWQLESFIRNDTMFAEIVEAAENLPSPDKWRPPPELRDRLRKWDDFIYLKLALELNEDAQRHLPKASVLRSLLSQAVDSVDYEEKKRLYLFHAEEGLKALKEMSARGISTFHETDLYKVGHSYEALGRVKAAPQIEVSTSVSVGAEDVEEVLATIERAPGE